MAESNFIDYVKIHCQSGKGGAGSTHFRRDKLTAMGGPDGGDGGRGGHIILRGNKQLWTLLHLKFRKHVRAADGEKGRGANQTGAEGEDIILEVPLGTVAKDAETGEELFEITEEGEQKILLAGGMGGLGNQHFKTSTNQVPQYAQPGIPAKEGWMVLELKILADVGLVGHPNAGKSTLLNHVSAAKPKIADYPFTTLVPNLGVVAYRGYQSFVMADIPGIIEGASEGKGLGYRFLKHIERNAVLLYMVPSDSADIMKEYEILREELRQFNDELILKEHLLAISKSDLLDNELKEEIAASLPAGLQYQFISGVTGEGITELKDKLWERIERSMI